MVELDWIRQGLSDRRPGIVAERTGLHTNTIINIRDGKANNPNLRTLQKLYDYLSAYGS